MGKLKKFGMNPTCNSNVQANMRYHKNVYQHGRETAGRDLCDETINNQYYHRMFEKAMTKE